MRSMTVGKASKNIFAGILRPALLPCSTKKVVGVILAGHDGRRGYIHHTAVRSEYRGQGIGTTLVNMATEALSNKGIIKAALVAFCQNESGNAFWEKMGFLLREDLTYRNKILTGSGEINQSADSRKDV